MKDDKYYILKLKEDEDLYNIFMFIGEYSIKTHSIGLVEATKVNINDLIEKIQSKVLDKAPDIIRNYIDRLISYKLLQISDNSEEIGLTSGDLFSEQSTGISVYQEIESTESYEESKQGITDYFANIEDKLKNLETRITETTHNLDSGILKNVQVISVFVGIISLLFANIIGIKDFQNIGILGLAIINFCMVLSIFALIVFTKLLIIGDKIKSETIFVCIIILVLLIIPIILMATNVINPTTFINAVQTSNP